MRKAILLLLALVSFFGCSRKEKVVIWTAENDFVMEMYSSELKKKFPQYDISLEYMNTSNIAAKVLEEKDNCKCDMILSEECAYLQMCSQYFAEPEGLDFSVFQDGLVPESHLFVPNLKNGGCIIINGKMLRDKGLAIPESYSDLLKPEYKDLISMPSPTSSGTAYMFVLMLVNEWGEAEAFDYFSKLDKNILQYTSSGSGALNLLVKNEVAIALGMTSQAVFEKNSGKDLTIRFFKEGSPYSMCGNALMRKSKDKQSAKEVFGYMSTELTRKSCELFYPERIYKDYAPVVKGFPEDIRYGNMAGDTIETKKRLLSKWSFS